jgi:hypothetical protein
VGGGVCFVVPPPIYETQVYTREYIAECAAGTDVKWRYLEWQATIPAGTSIAFGVQTKMTAAASYQPLTPLSLGSASSTTAAGAWTRSSQTVEDLFLANNMTSRTYMKLTVTFNPNATGLLAPTLRNWRQIYDCVPAQ